MYLYMIIIINANYSCNPPLEDFLSKGECWSTDSYNAFILIM